MAKTLIQLYKNIFTYDGDDVYMAFADNTTEPYFHAKQLAKLLGYVDYRDAIRTHVDKKDIYYLQDIVKDYKLLYKNIQGHTKFLNEGGMLTLVIKSKHKKANEINHWITHEVLPAIRKYGVYNLEEGFKQQIDELKEIINAKTQENEILKHNLKKTKFKKDSIVYILRTIDDTTNLEMDTDEILVLRFGKSEDMEGRKPQYDTGSKNRVQLIKQIPVKDIEMIEKCVFARMKNYKIRSNSSFLECTYNQLIDAVAECVKFFNNVDIDKTPDIHKNIERESINKFNRDEKFLIKIEFDEDDKDDEDDEGGQIGGILSLQHNIEINYLTYKLKYLELKCKTSYLLTELELQ